MPTAVAQRQPVKEERFVPGIHSVQGINSRIEDIKLRGAKFLAVIGDTVVEATLVRKITGASELTLSVLDPNGKLLRSKLLEEAHELTLDGLHWKLVKVGSEGQNEPLTLTYEPLIVYLLKKLKGPNKAFRDKMTRAEFAKARAFEARPRPRFIAPELQVVQEIASAAQGKEAKKKAQESRGKGIGVHDPNLKINTRPATKAQAEIIDRMLRTAESVGAATKVMEALVLAVIDESVVGTLSDNLLQIEPESVSGFSGDPTNPEQSAMGFLRGYEPAAPNALGVYKANPEYSPAQIATTVQRNAAGAGPYERFTEEARAWVAAYGGGGEVATRDTTRYAFQQSKTESNWHCMVRLASEVRWRCFESAAWIYFLDEPTLLRSSRRMRVSDSAPGIIDTSFDYDVGKEVTEVTVECLAKTWAAPPGSVAAVSRHGPADGLYLVEQIESKPSSRKEVVNVTLRKPTEALPEPAAKALKSSTSFGGTSNASGTIGGMGALEGTPEDVVNQVIDYAHANGFPAVTRESVRAANGSHGPTISGGTSDHQGPPSVRWAADISNGSAPTEEMTHLAAAIAKAFKIPWSGSGLVTHESGGYRMQLIYKTMEGGNHFNHVHFGCAA